MGGRARWEKRERESKVRNWGESTGKNGRECGVTNLTTFLSSSLDQDSVGESKVRSGRRNGCESRVEGWGRVSEREEAGRWEAWNGDLGGARETRTAWERAR